jgi:hypothetical protein
LGYLYHQTILGHCQKDLQKRKGKKMNGFRNWYLNNITEITWFLIGLLVSGGIDSLAREQYGNAALSFGIAYLNYILNKR